MWSGKDEEIESRRRQWEELRRRIRVPFYSRVAETADKHRRTSDEQAGGYSKAGGK